MCEPTTIIAGATLAIGALSAYGQYQQGKSQQRVANANADAQEIAARDTINTGNDQAAQQRQQTRQLQGQQAAAFGAAGTDMTSGSALNIFGNTAQGGQLDALTTINNAERQGAGLNFQAGVSRAQGQIDRNAANLGATTTILNSALSAYGSYQSSGALDKPAAKSGGSSSNNMFTNARGSRYGANAYTF
ncbi:Uncharacterised protein [Serratia ficaria]|uniref:hypothetical protein n=1 Tax=Serratia ficaria TaxID=61651 RepID=UPI00217C428E|nr:hypothetical protein [Serratia ficaria]CAI1026047.1 Uncharacterised protein [Serratia ficaria]CAI1857301.1 Uncharacterised protein [Serratia ficaria]CAI2472574.1 Uncharacterised protein [Serratia ficaria]